MRIGLVLESGADDPGGESAPGERLIRALRDAGRHEYLVLSRRDAEATDGFDLMHEMAGTPSVVQGTAYARVLTVADPLHLLLKHRRSADVMNDRPALGRNLRRYDQIITFSEHAKHDAIRLFGLPDTRISVTPAAADERFAPGDAGAALAELRRRFDLPGDRFLLHVSDGPTATLSAAVTAFRQIRALAPDVRLVVVASSSPTMSVPTAEPENRVDVIGDASDDDLALLYRAALALVYAPLRVAAAVRALEAMQSGCPVIASTVPGVAEVTGDATLTCAPEDIDGAAAAMLRVSRDDGLRAGLRCAGIARAAEFTWARTAETTVAAYERALVVRAGRGGAMGLRHAA